MLTKHTAGAGVRKPCRREGYSLIEVMCSLFIAAIAATVLFIGFDNGFAILRTTREDLRATQILMQKTEAVRLCTWQQLTNCTTFSERYYPAGILSTNSGTLYVGKMTVAQSTDSSIPASYRGNLYVVTISVNWTNNIGSKSTPHSRQIQTLWAVAGMQSYLSSVGN